MAWSIISSFMGFRPFGCGCGCCGCVCEGRLGLGGLVAVLGRENPEVVELGVGRVERGDKIHALALELRNLAVDLARLLDHHLGKQTLAELCDRHDGLRTLARLVGGAGGGTVVAALAVHASIIAAAVCEASPLRRNSETISIGHKCLWHQELGAFGYQTPARGIVNGMWITSGVGVGVIVIGRSSHSVHAVGGC